MNLFDYKARLGVVLNFTNTATMITENEIKYLSIFP